MHPPPPPHMHPPHMHPPPPHMHPPPHLHPPPHIQYWHYKISLFGQDDEGREVAIKIDRVDSKKFSAETATKSYVEVRSEY